MEPSHQPLVQFLRLVSCMSTLDYYSLTLLTEKSFDIVLLYDAHQWLIGISLIISWLEPYHQHLLHWSHLQSCMDFVSFNEHTITILHFTLDDILFYNDSFHYWSHKTTIHSVHLTQIYHYSFHYRIGISVAISWLEPFLNGPIEPRHYSYNTINGHVHSHLLVREIVIRSNVGNVSHNHQEWLEVSWKRNKCILMTLIFDIQG